MKTASNAHRRVVVALGTRPEAIKLAPVVLALRKRGVDTLVVSTGQHREMLDQTLKVFDLGPDRDHQLMRPDQSLAGLSAGILAAVDDTLREVEPSCVLVEGDTTTVAMVAPAAFYRNIPVGHVEAGLRTHHKHDPFPEEMNHRTLVGSLADLHFAPTPGARDDLLSVTRRTSARQEAIDSGMAELAGTDPANLVAAGRPLLTEPDYYASRAVATDAFGDGRSKRQDCARCYG